VDIAFSIDILLVFLYNVSLYYSTYVERVIPGVYDVLASGCIAIMGRLLSCTSVWLLVAGGVECSRWYSACWRLYNVSNVGFLLLVCHLIVFNSELLCICGIFLLYSLLVFLLFLLFS
jgi:hypothetical protein